MDEAGETARGSPPPSPSPLMRAKHIFLAVRDLSPPDRPGELERLCAGDAELRHLVESLIAADLAPPPFESIANGIVAARDALDSASRIGGDGLAPDTQPGDRIGRYRLLERIGEGGFGVVYLAEQDEPVRRQVAFKIIKLGMDTRQVVARFEQERQALALMDHPNIAKVHDAGASPAGRPYFVMEFCRGRAITACCDEARMSVPDRLRLFVQVCHAVQHAHQKGVIHRDLKPSNVLVCNADERPFAKVIDFGIAKAVQGHITDRTMHTEHGHPMGTPAYMSPEQARGDADIDTRTDIYSLGVLLHELVTGDTPIPAESLRSTPTSSMYQLLAGMEAKLPSTRIRPDESGSRAAAARGVDVVHLRNSLRRELDWIILRALDRDRQRRYGTAAELAADVERHLAGEAVLAAPPSRLYAVRKALRRHRGAVFAAFLVFAALTLGLIGTISQALAARRQADVAQAAATAEAERSRELAAVTEFQSQMLARINAFDVGVDLRKDLRERLQGAQSRSQRPSGDQAAVLTEFDDALDSINLTDAATDLVDRVLLKPAIAEIEDRFADNPGVNLQLRETVGYAYESLGRWTSAREQFNHALDSATRLFGADSEKALLARFEIAYIVNLQGDRDQAQRLLEEMLPVMRRVLGLDNESTLRAGVELAHVMRMQGRREEAIALYRDALERYERTPPRAAEMPLMAMTGLAKTLTLEGQLVEAEQLLRASLQGYRTLAREDHDSILAAEHNLGQFLLQKHDLDGAKEALEHVVTCRTSQLGLAHPRTANSVLLLAQVIAARGDVPAAQAQITSLLAALPPGQTDRPLRIRAHTKLGLILQRAARFADAEASFLESRSLAVAANRPTQEADRLLQSLYRDWQAADPASGAGDKLAEMNRQLQSAPDDRGSTARPMREGED